MDPPNNQPPTPNDEESLDSHLENWHKLLSSDNNNAISTPSTHYTINSQSFNISSPRKRRKKEIIEVKSNRIVRSAGRKDRHSKVCTSRGPKDRRVRLSPRTAIRFYDVQDRLGCDRPSKAIDWLMKEAKIAIDGLDVPNVKSNPTSSSSVFANVNVPFEDSTLLSHMFDNDVEMDRLQRIFNEEGECAPVQAPVLFNNQMFSQREPLQSSFNDDSQINNEFPCINFYSNQVLSNYTATLEDDHEKDTNIVVSSKPSSAASFPIN